MPIEEVDRFVDTLLADEATYLSPIEYSIHPLPPDVVDSSTAEGVSGDINRAQILDYCLISAGGKSALREKILRRRAFIRIAGSFVRRSPGSGKVEIPAVSRADEYLDTLQRDLALVHQGAEEGTVLYCNVVHPGGVRRVQYDGESLGFQELN